MSDESKEAISALADGEDSAGNTAKLLDKVTLDPLSRATWERYHLLSDAIKGRLPDQIQTGLSDRIHDAIAQEPVVLATRRKRRGILKPLTGLALAASVATVAILGVRSLDSEITPAAQIAATAKTPQTTGNRWNVSPEIEARLNAYLVNHSEYVGYGMQGMLPYARIVGYDSTE